jgi:Flp pilus assembly protein TadG
MKTTHLKAYKGQIMILMAFVLVALLGFAALAIDGGMIYSDHRAAQSVADAAALAGAAMAGQNMENLSVGVDNFSCSNSNVINAENQGIFASINRAATNNVTIDGDISDKNGVHVTCTVNDLGSYKDSYLDFKVMVSLTTQTSFAQLFYSGPVDETAESVVRIHPRTSLGFGYAVATMGKDCSTGGFHGNGNTTIHSTHGGVFSNSCFSFTNGSTHVYVNDPGGLGCRYVSGSVNPAWCDVPIVKSSVQLKPYVVPEPECSLLPTYGAVSGDATLNPGNYPGINSKGTITMNPGLYCFTGDVSFGSQATVVGNGVTLYFKNNAGLSTAAGANITLTAPTGESSPAIRGMLIFGAFGNSGTIEFGGHAASTYRGTIYMPDGTILAHGTPQMNAIESQLVAKMVNLDGTSDLFIDFNGDLNYQIPAVLDQLQ